ncbi:MAG: RNA polymerase sigma factor [Thermoguttaceae bacterium]
MNNTALDIKDCMDGVRRKDAAAAHDLVEHLYPLVIRIVRSHLPRRCGEEDLAQEVFLKLFSRLDGYRERPGIPFEHWVSRLAVRTCLDSLRAERRRPELRWGDLAEETVAWLRYMVSAADVTPHTSATAARESLEVLLRQLLPADRLVITLLDLEERSVKEVSQITGWSITLVKVRVFRARRRLRKIGWKWKGEEPYE